jgi:hypothetical protein
MKGEIEVRIEPILLGEGIDSAMTTCPRLVATRGMAAPTIQITAPMVETLTCLLNRHRLEMLGSRGFRIQTVIGPQRTRAETRVSAVHRHHLVLLRQIMVDRPTKTKIMAA